MKLERFRLIWFTSAVDKAELEREEKQATLGQVGKLMFSFQANPGYL